MLEVIKTITVIHHHTVIMEQPLVGNHLMLMLINCIVIIRTNHRNLVTIAIILDLVNLDKDYPIIHLSHTYEI